MAVWALSMPLPIFVAKLPVRFTYSTMPTAHTALHCMPSLSELIEGYSRSVQPLVFETGLEDFPYSTAGTVFLIGYGGKPFVITTRHGLRPDVPCPICVFPSDRSHRLIPLDDVFYVPHTDEPEDFMDLAIMTVDTSGISNTEVANAHLIALSPQLPGWPEHAVELVLIGYPAEHSVVDPVTELLHTERVVLNGCYVGPSPLPHLHMAKITDAHTLSTFSGFSGGPVFAVIRAPGLSPTAGLCGMAIRGSPSSNIIHFLDRGVLMDALEMRSVRKAAGSQRV